jgi:conjugal transfer pilus assembly protein TraU
MIIRKVLPLFFMLIMSMNLQALSCNGKFTNPITDVCWSCLFPLTVGAGEVASGSNPDTENPASPLCVCKDPIIRPGIAIGYWEPIALVDVTTKPFCMVNLGVKFDAGASYKLGKVDAYQGGTSNSFYNVHWYKFPLMLWLNIITNTACLQMGEFDIAYLTELDPTWQDDELAFILNPEAVLFGNHVAQASCAADAIATTTGVKNLTSALFWCAGAQGSMYPLTGRVQNHVGGVQASTLLTERMAFKMHRQLLLWDSVGETSKLCNEYPMPIMPKHRYRYQMVNPVASTGKRDGCKPFGASTVTWEAGHEIPVKGEDFGYLVWRKRNCCAF